MSSVRGLFLFLALSFVSGLPNTRVEFQHELEASYAASDRSGFRDALWEWIDDNLEKGNVANLTIRKSTSECWARRVVHYTAPPLTQTLVKYRKALSEGQHDLSWKIRGVTAASDDSLWGAAAGLSVRWKLERNVYCNRLERNDYTRFVDFPYSAGSPALATAADASRFFPYFSRVHGLADETELVGREFYEWVCDVAVRVGREQQEGKLTLQITYDSFGDYFSDRLPAGSSRQPELSYKMKRSDVDDWGQANADMQHVYDIMQSSQWINRTSCTPLAPAAAADSGGAQPFPTVGPAPGGAARLASPVPLLLLLAAASYLFH